MLQQNCTYAVVRYGARAHMYDVWVLTIYCRFQVKVNWIFNASVKKMKIQ